MKSLKQPSKNYVIAVVSIPEFENLINQVSQDEKERYNKYLKAAKKVSQGDKYLNSTTSVMLMQGGQIIISTRVNEDTVIEVGNKIESIDIGDIFKYNTEHTKVTETEVKEYINNISNPPAHRQKLSELLERFMSTNAKYPNRISMYVARNGTCDLWLD